jgi:SPP1 family phage portal protein
LNQDIICAGVLDEQTLGSAVAEFFRTVRPERQRLYDYYAGQQPVPKGEAVRGRPDNRLHVPFPRYITEVHTGYFLGVPPTLTFPTSADTEAYAEVSGAEGLPGLLFAAARDMSICGTGFLLVWLERSGLRISRCDPQDCFCIHDATAGNPLRATVRLYQRPDGVTEGILYLPEQLRFFTWDGSNLRWDGSEENLLHKLSLIPFSNNLDATGDFAGVTGLVDAYNLLLSGAMDDMQSVANAFLALYGMQGTTQKDIDEANRTRILSLSEGGRAEFVVKNLNQDALNTLEGNLRRSILQLSMTPDLSDESFSGNASGVALQYKLWGIEQVRAAKERQFTLSLRRLLAAISGGFSVLGRNVAMDGTATFYKNLPQNTDALCETLLSLEGILSHRTILENLPWVTDVDEELKRKKEETATAE